MTKHELMIAVKNATSSVIDRTGNCCANSELVTFLANTDVRISEIGQQTYLLTPVDDTEAFGLEQSFVVLMPLPPLQAGVIEAGLC